MPRPRRELFATSEDAHIAVGRAVVDGLLVEHPPACTVCGTAGYRQNGRWSVVYHHHSYEVEHHLDVVAVCWVCHGRIHAGQLPEPVTGVHRPLLHGERVRRAA